MSLILSFEVIAGDQIDRTCDELQAVADKLGVIAAADFNGVRVRALPGGDAKILHANWQKSFASTATYKSAWSK